MEIANEQGKWLLVNIQDRTEFNCHRLNRDTWTDAGVQVTVRESFKLWQVCTCIQSFNTMPSYNTIRGETLSVDISN